MPKTSGSNFEISYRFGKTKAGGTQRKIHPKPHDGITKPKVSVPPARDIEPEQVPPSMR